NFTLEFSACYSSLKDAVKTQPIFCVTLDYSSLEYAPHLAQSSVLSVHWRARIIAVHDAVVQLHLDPRAITVAATG
ncbi:MAG: hypothetical protein Q7J80_04760, partial [Anaerolineales bacterium]|nr:hypothetical protein [Anaerolineales bacterium]